ncbi:uncharacterized protein LOC116005627 [Ipomoea triloba]|uniref:uncharacterized protein LOC116005627 n=1 Tax=Ipomoea triloba TaxID=35885 RepID=UPI00125E3B64|nr:uncharacterized protein LOC116005627 [Ipomoea triloba]
MTFYDRNNDKHATSISLLRHTQIFAPKFQRLSLNSSSLLQSSLLTSPLLPQIFLIFSSSICFFEGEGARGGLPTAEATEGQGPEQLSRPASREEADGERSTGHRAGQQASSRARAAGFPVSDFRFPNSVATFRYTLDQIRKMEESTRIRKESEIHNLRSLLNCQLKKEFLV